MVLCPTRELAKQNRKVAFSLNDGALKIGCFYGGSSRTAQYEAIADGKHWLSSVWGVVTTSICTHIFVFDIWRSFRKAKNPCRKSSLFDLYVMVSHDFFQFVLKLLFTTGSSGIVNKKVIFRCYSWKKWLCSVHILSSLLWRFVYDQLTGSNHIIPTIVDVRFFVERMHQASICWSSRRLRYFNRYSRKTTWFRQAGRGGFETMHLLRIRWSRHNAGYGIWTPDS